MEILKYLASGGIGAVLIILFFTIKWLINKQNNQTKNTNSININNNTNEKLDWVLTEIKDIKKSIKDIEDQQRKGDAAFLFFVETTSIDINTKNTIKKLLQN